MIEELINHLRKHAKLEDSIDVERFDATLSQIAGLDDPRAIGLLLPFFKDQCKFPEVMSSIVHTIEMFDDKTYAQEIIKALPTFTEQSPYWATKIHFAIFNHPPSREAYRKQLAGANLTIKAAAKNFFKTMREREPRFVEACDEMIAVL